MRVQHQPIFITDFVCETYSEREGVPVTYVCTTSLTGRGKDVDVFYRETPHPEFGNRYFGLFPSLSRDCIVNADSVEDLTFVCIEGPTGYVYSSHVHDFVSGTGGSIDGGREYTRIVGNPTTVVMTVKDGIFG